MSKNPKPEAKPRSIFFKMGRKQVFRRFVAVVITWAFVFLGSCAVSNEGPSKETPEQLDSDTNLAPIVRTVTDFRELMVDLAVAQGSEYLKGRILTLSSRGAEVQGSGEQPATGVLWIDKCDISEVDDTHVRIELSGIGWRWIERHRYQTGAKFELDENVRFKLSMSVVGTFDIAYDAAEHILTVWMAMTEPVEAQFQLVGNVDVRTESLWSSIVGQAAGLIGQSPGQRAAESIRKKSVRRVQAKLKQGFTLILDLCTGRRYTKLGTAATGELPDLAVSEGGYIYEVNSSGELHNDGMLMAGPFKNSRDVVAIIKAGDEGPVKAWFMCSDKARRACQAYVSGEEAEFTQMIAATEVALGQQATMRAPAGSDCEVVLVMKKGAKGAVVPVNYAVYIEGHEARPWLNCDNSNLLQQNSLSEDLKSVENKNILLNNGELSKKSDVEVAAHQIEEKDWKYVYWIFLSLIVFAGGIVIFNKIKHNREGS